MCSISVNKENHNRKTVESFGLGYETGHGAPYI